jgi:hypothetical protein
VQASGQAVRPVMPATIIKPKVLPKAVAKAVPKTVPHAVKKISKLRSN